MLIFISLPSKSRGLSTMLKQPEEAAALSVFPAKAFVIRIWTEQQALQISIELESSRVKPASRDNSQLWL